MNLLWLLILVVLFFIGLKILKTAIKTVLVLLVLFIVTGTILGYLTYKDYSSLKTQKIIFLEKDEQTLEMADRYITFEGGKTNLTSIGIVKEYWKGDIEVYPQTILFKTIRAIR